MKAIPGPAPSPSATRWAWVSVGLMMLITLLFGTDLFSRQNTLPILWWILSWFGGEPVRVIPQFSDQEGMLRKSAHFLEYAALAALWYRALARWPIGDHYLACAAFALLATAAWAGVDEWQQAFVSQQRTGSLADVGLDVLGGATALALIGLVRLMRKI